MNGKLIIKKPIICVCVIKIDGVVKQIHGNEIELPFGSYKINVGIKYYDSGDVGMDHGHSHWSDIEWAWGNDKEVIVDEKITTIKIKRKWHLLRHITAKASIEKCVC